MRVCTYGPRTSVRLIVSIALISSAVVTLPVPASAHHCLGEGNIEIVVAMSSRNVMVRHRVSRVEGLFMRLGISTARLPSVSTRRVTRSTSGRRMSSLQGMWRIWALTQRGVLVVERHLLAGRRPGACL